MRIIAIAVVFLVATGCYPVKATTPVNTYARKNEARQFFFLNGLVPVSEPAATECTKGVQMVTVKADAIDVLLELALFGGGALLGSAMCDRPECVTAMATLVPYAIGSRTIEYECIE